MPGKHNFVITLAVTKYCNYMLSKSSQKINVQAITVKHVHCYIFYMRLRCSERDIYQDILFQICHFLLYIFIFSGRIFWQEEQTRRMPLKRKSEDAGGYPGAKRARLKQQTCMSLEDAEEIVGALGKTTSSAHSNLLLNGKGDDDDVLVLDTDKDLLQEMDELLRDLKL
jgi:hypothetical protein